ncbi:hypothetical protein [Pseudomonas sp. 34 E 7]|nr:hypothetical protein [Pseudomonas sp. 34 E 7]
MVEVGAQLGFAPGEGLLRVDTLQRVAQRHQPAVQLLLVQLDKVRLAGVVEQHAGEQRNHRGARGKQQCQAAGEGQALDHVKRSSST